MERQSPRRGFFGTEKTRDGESDLPTQFWAKRCHIEVRSSVDLGTEPGILARRLGPFDTFSEPYTSIKVLLSARSPLAIGTGCSDSVAELSTFPGKHRKETKSLAVSPFLSKPNLESKRDPRYHRQSCRLRATRGGSPEGQTPMSVTFTVVGREF
jgi:hypothetical protein